MIPAPAAGGQRDSLPPYWSSDDGDVTLYLGDCLDVLPSLPDCSVDAVVTDPPYGLAELSAALVLKAIAAWMGGDRAHVPDGRGFMGREWDRFVPPPGAWDECMRVLKPGGHLLSFAGSRTIDLMTLSIRIAGFEIRDSMAWLYGQGYPKSLDVAKAIDKRRDDRPHILRVTSWLADAAEAKGIGRAQVDAHMGTSDMGGWWLSRLEHRCAVPTWEQWGQLRALLGFGDEMDAEVWRLNGRKGEPGEAWGEREIVGTGHRVRRESTVQIVGLSEGAYDITAAASEGAKRWEGWGTALKPAHEPIVVARKPLAGTVAQNVLAHGTGAINVAACKVGTETRTNNAGGASSLQRVSRVEQGYRPTVTTSEGQPSEVAGRWPPNVLLDPAAAEELDRQSGMLTSGANPTRRGSDKFRDAYGEFAGQTECTPQRGADSGGASRFFPVFRYEAKASASERPRTEDGAAHSTVKPVDLMAWLVRLVTPPGGLVLDPFAGSGTTAEACIVEGFRCVLIEQDPKSAALIRKRLSKPIQPVMFGFDEAS